MFEYLLEKIKNGQYNETLKSTVDLHTLDNFFTQEHYNKLSKETETFKEYEESDCPHDGKEPTVISLNDIRTSVLDSKHFYYELIKFFKNHDTIKTVLTTLKFTDQEAEKLVNFVMPTTTLHTDYSHQSDNIHNDQKNNFFTITLQIYLPDDDSIKEYGTQFYNSKNEKIYKTDFIPNSGYLMLSNNNAWHQSINGVFRKSIVVRYSVLFDVFKTDQYGWIDGHEFYENENQPIVFNRNRQNDTCCIIWNKDMEVFLKITDWFANMTFHNCIDLGFENISVINKPFKWDLYALKIFKYSYGFKKAFIFFGGFEWKNKEVYEYAVNLDMKDKVIAGLLDEDQFLRQCVIINLDKLDELDIDDAHGDGGFFERFIGRHISIEDMWLPRNYYHPEVDEDKIVSSCLCNSNNIDDFPKLEYIKKYQTKITLEQYQKAIRNTAWAPYGDQFAYLDSKLENLKPINETTGKVSAFHLSNFFNDDDYKKIAQDVIDAHEWTKKEYPIDGVEPSIITFDQFEKHEDDNFYGNMWKYFNTDIMKRKILKIFGYKKDPSQILKCMPQSITFHTEYPHQIDNIHSDQKFTLSTFTLQIYLPQDNSIENYGTQFVSNSGETLYHKKFLPNQGYIMQSNNNSWHKPTMGVSRKSLLVRWTIELEFQKTKRVFNYERNNTTCYVVWNKAFDKVHTKITDWFAIASLQNAQEQDIKNVVATSNIKSTLQFLKQLGYTDVIVCNGGHIFNDSNVQQYSVSIEDALKTDIGKISGNNVNYYEPTEEDSAELLSYIQKNKGVEYVHSDFPELAEKLEYIKPYRNNHSTLFKMAESISPLTIMWCENCQKECICCDLPSNNGFWCYTCETRIYDKVENYISFTDYKEEDFRE